MHAASNILAHAGYGTGPSSTVTEADEIEFLRNLDAFLCLLDPRCEGDAIAPTAGESSGEGNWVRSVYLDRLMRGLDTERVSVVEKWVEGRFGGGEGLGAYVRVLDGFLGVLEGRTGDPVVERAMRGVDQ